MSLKYLLCWQKFWQRNDEKWYDLVMNLKLLKLVHERCGWILSRDIKKIYCYRINLGLFLLNCSVIRNNFCYWCLCVFNGIVLLIVWVWWEIVTIVYEWFLLELLLFMTVILSRSYLGIKCVGEKKRNCASEFSLTCGVRMWGIFVK